MKKPLMILAGMGPGISLATARKFGKEGFRIAMIARNDQKLNDYREQLAKENIEARGYSCDVADFKGLENTFSKIKQDLGACNLFMFNVSVFREAAPTALSPEVLIEDFKANVASLLVCVQAVVPQLEGQEKGTIFITGGGLALNPYPPFSSLAAGKAGMRNLAYSIAGELQPRKIRVTTYTICGMVAPGTKYDPQIIAENYWQIYQLPDSEWKTEHLL